MPKLRPIAAPLVLLLLTLVVHAPTLAGGFVADDYPKLQFFHQDEHSDDTPGIQAGPLWAAFFQPVPTEQRPRYHRPLTELSLWVDHVVFGTWAPGFRAVQLAWFALSALLLLVLLEALGAGRGLAFAGAAGFALFPTNYASLMWVSDRGAWLALALGLASLLCFVRGSGADGGRRRLLAGLFLFLALLSKESAVVLVALFPLLWLWARRAVGGAATVALGRAAWPIVTAVVLALTWRYLRLGTLLGGPRSLDQYALGTLLADQLSVLRVLLVPIRAEAFPGLYAQWLELPVAALLLAGILRGADRFVAAFTGAWLLLSLLPNLYDATVPGTQVNARFTMPAAAPYAVLVVLSLAGWFRGRGGRDGTRPRPRPARAFVAVGLAVAVCQVVLLVGNRAAWQRAGRRAPGIVATLHDIARSPGQAVAVYDLPSYDGNAPLLLNAFPFALRHPFLAERRRELHAFDSGPLGTFALVRSQSLLARHPDLVWMRWDPVIDAPVRTSPIEGIEGSGEVRRDGDALRFAPTGQRLRGFTQDLAQYAGEVVDLRGLSMETARGSEILVVWIRRR